MKILLTIVVDLSPVLIGEEKDRLFSTWWTKKLEVPPNVELEDFITEKVHERLSNIPLNHAKGRPQVLSICHSILSD